MDDKNIDELYISRCLYLAQKGRSSVAPNPMVGAVIVYENQIIGEGYHQKYGEAHAEVNAINSVKNKELLEHSTIYVSLEPCAHYGKTPPCADLIINNGIPNVVIGMQDPFAEVDGAGILRLRNAGVNVRVGVLEDECKELIKEFVTFHKNKRPYIILKWAQTLDGFIDKDRKNDDIGEPNWITNEVCRALVHKWRTEVQTIMVGTNTAYVDNPKLNVRSWVGGEPIRILIDKKLKIPLNYNLLDGSQTTYILNEIKEQTDGNTHYIKFVFGDSFMNRLNSFLYKKGINTLFVEGGLELLNTFISSGNWDEARVFTGNKKFVKGVEAPAIKGVIVSQENLRDNVLTVYKQD